MFAVSVDSSLLGERLDAGFYRPAFLAMEKALRTKGAIKLETLVDSVACGPFGGNAIADDLYEKDGVAFIRPVNISSHVFDDSSLVRVPKKNLVANGLKIYQGTNIYFGRVGDPCVAIIEGESSISPNIIIACTKGDLADPYYIYSFAASNYGLQQLKRQLKTVAQPTTSTDAIRGLLIFKPENAAQKYIGDKIRQAERLRAGGKLVHSRVLDSFESLLGHYDKQNKSFERVSPDLLADRLDQNHYKTSLLSCLKLLQLKKHVSLADKKYFAGLTDGDHGNPKYGEGPIYLRASEMTGGLISIDSVARIDPEYAKGVSISCWAKADDIIFSVVGTLGLTAIVDSRTAGLMSRGVAKIASNILPNYYVKAFFKTHYFQAQLERHSVGSVQRGVYLSALEQIIVPILEQSIIEEISESEMLADDMVKAATVLTNTAKLLVEALIEGHLTEAELIAAEQALQASNDQLDRRILNRLRTDGVDGRGQALFADLDELYHLLAQAEGD